MKNLKVTTVQAFLTWENPTANCAHFEKLLEGFSNTTDLVFLPEMFSTGFSMNPQPIAEPMDGPTMQWMSKISNNINAVVTGSIIIEENGKFFNRLIWMRPDGSYETYDKRHLFTLAGEHKQYTAGDKKITIDLHGWKICPMICYDLRFPVWARNNVGYDVLFYVANWPDKRSNAWRSLLTARAIENQCYTIGVNRVGQDESKLNYNGFSSIISYDGAIIHTVENKEEVFTTELNYEKLHEFRKKLAFLDDRDEYTIVL